ncbi:hypothetical protein [Streptomyces sp. NPDC006997]|uniref:hypothetical protein n=1 Tax=Streptomyces sp. NPDC006997 TaxID=3155356 RepID=UPI0033F7F629
MLTSVRTRTLAAALGASAWAHPYADPFTCYADGGDGGGDGDQGGGDADGGDDQDGDDDRDDDRDGDDQGDDADGDLGEKGKKALRALRRENRQLKAQLRQAGSGAASSGGSGKGGSTDDGQGDDADAIREQARAEARAEVWAERVEAAAIAQASGRLANPQLAARLLHDQLADIGEDDKGRPDKAAITELIDELLEDEPYLAVPAKGAGRRFQGDADSGARKTTKKAASLGEAVANRLAGKTGS